jgi:hypothetical protein
MTHERHRLALDAQAVGIDYAADAAAVLVRRSFSVKWAGSNQAAENCATGLTTVKAHLAVELISGLMPPGGGIERAPNGR